MPCTGYSHSSLPHHNIQAGTHHQWVLIGQQSEGIRIWLQSNEKINNTIAPVGRQVLFPDILYRRSRRISYAARPSLGPAFQFSYPTQFIMILSSMHEALEPRLDIFNVSSLSPTRIACENDSGTYLGDSQMIKHLPKQPGRSLLVHVSSETIFDQNFQK